jgi:hypothetical protein
VRVRVRGTSVGGCVMLLPAKYRHLRVRVRQSETLRRLTTTCVGVWWWICQVGRLGGGAR